MIRKLTAELWLATHGDQPLDLPPGRYATDSWKLWKLDGEAAEETIIDATAPQTTPLSHHSIFPINIPQIARKSTKNLSNSPFRRSFSAIFVGVEQIPQTEGLEHD